MFLKNLKIINFHFSKIILLPLPDGGDRHHGALLFKLFFIFLLFIF
jgi:hypothetical protein